MHNNTQKPMTHINAKTLNIKIVTKYEQQWTHTHSQANINIPNTENLFSNF